MGFYLFCFHFQFVKFLRTMTRWDGQVSKAPLVTIVDLSGDGSIYVTGRTDGRLNGQMYKGRRHCLYHFKCVNIFITQVVLISS